MAVPVAMVHTAMRLMLAKGFAPIGSTATKVPERESVPTA